MQKGFTLIELMIVVGVIGILVAVAIPFYQKDYTIRARVTEGLNMAVSAKLAVSETAITNNALPANQAATSYVSPAATPNIFSIAITANGVTTVTYTAAAGGGTIVLTPSLQANGDVTWDCTQGTLNRRYRPVNCRP
ncbi:pilin [Nitrosomonas communis]|uniref:Type IV pilus assembly protein PilA n=1 Tax=Nitrosomonas communis TaxID=44574 RepID=A0A1H2VCE7_9PROT|nr:pilin [Nitrosomonas communis]SDW66028.1 type IV pilus assembly protein PilA [Nitrosomonas communis]